MRRHSVGCRRWWDRKSANSLTPDLCIALTMIDLGINHWNSMYVLALRVLETTPTCLFIYDTVVVLSDSIDCLAEDILLQMQEGQADCPELTN